MSRLLTKVAASRAGRLVSAAVAGALAGGLALAVSAGPAGATTGPLTAVNGTGSSYAGLAFQQWQADGTTQGLPVNYTPTNSPQGLTEFQNGIVPYAGTEAEFSSLLGVPNANIPGGFQYTPDVAGATAIMYNVNDSSGRKVTYLHLTQRTVARIFMGYVSNWSDPEITAENLNIPLPSGPITVVYRSGQSGTNALFFDFVAHADPSEFAAWALKNNLPTQTRIISLDNAPHFAPNTLPVTASDQQAQTVESQEGTISYDEFAYPKTYGVPVAWIENGAGKYTQPYALNISSALASATLNTDLSQNLAGVYASTNPLAYPISAYSYIVTKCSTGAAQAPNCGGTYADPGVSNTMAQWMSYIACAGQSKMAEIGYAPLPAVLSQDLADAVSRIDGQPAAGLSASNCANPQESGNLGVGAAGPVDPYIAVLASGGGGSAGGGANMRTAPSSGSGSTAAGGATTATTTTGSKTNSGGASGAQYTALGSQTTTPGGVPVAVGSIVTSTTLAAGQVSPTGVGVAGGATLSAGGGSGPVRRASPVAYRAPAPSGIPSLPLLVFLLVLGVPPLFLGIGRRVRG